MTFVNTNTNVKLIIGIGKTGISCVRYFISLGYNIIVMDTRITPPGIQDFKKLFPSVKLMLGKIDLKNLENIDEIIVSPGISLSDPLIIELLKYLNIAIKGDIELFANSTNVPIIAITGSNGKSTVTSLLGEMIKFSGKKVGIGGNLGTPSLDLLQIAEANFYVLELSSFQLELTNSLRAKAAVVLNITPDHMDRYRNLTEYINTKKKVYLNCEIAVINKDDDSGYKNLLLPEKKISFGIHNIEDSNFYLKNNWLMHRNNKLLHINNLKIKGMHNISNALAALALGYAINLPLKSMLDTLINFSGLPHRCQLVTTINKIEFYNDSKGTNIGSTKTVIESLGRNNAEKKIILIAGGVGKNADFSLLKSTIKKYVHTLVLIGQDATVIAKNLDSSCNNIIFSTTMQDAVRKCVKNAKPYDQILLSPACASTDMFKNFEERGEAFIYEINKILNEKFFSK